MSAALTRGAIDTSNELLNGILRISHRSQLSNMAGMGGHQSDCPHRERFGYGGDVVASMGAIVMQYDMADFYRDRLHSIQEAMAGPGRVTETAPSIGITDGGLGQGSGPPVWDSVIVQLPTLLSLHYGVDVLQGQRQALLQRMVDTMEFFALVAAANGGIIPTGLGDWSSIDPPDLFVNMSSTVWWYRDLRALASLAA